MRITVDTNILVSAAIVEGKQFELLKLAKEGKITLVLSLDILREFKEVISRPRFGFSQEQVNNVLKQIISISEIVIPIVKINAVKEDPDDNIVLEAAVAGNSDYIISGDRHLLDLVEYKKIKIVKSADFFKLFKTD